MHLDQLLTDSAVLAEFGRRVARHRLERNWTQAELASRAGVGQATVQRTERGESVQMTSMVKLLRALELLDRLDAAIPETIELPIAQLERGGRTARRRARAARGRDARSIEERPVQPTDERPWSWGDDLKPGDRKPEDEPRAPDERPDAAR